MSAHLDRLHDLPCVVCDLLGLEQLSVTEAHHVESIRDALSDYCAVSLCRDHHQGAMGVHGLSRRGFERFYKLNDVDLLALTIRALEKYGRLK